MKVVAGMLIGALLIAVGAITGLSWVAISGGAVAIASGTLIILNVKGSGDTALDIAQAGYATWSGIQVRPRWLWRLALGLALTIIGIGAIAVHVA